MLDSIVQRNNACPNWTHGLENFTTFIEPHTSHVRVGLHDNRPLEHKLVNKHITNGNNRIITTWENNGIIVLLYNNIGLYLLDDLTMTLLLHLLIILYNDTWHRSHGRQPSWTKHDFIFWRAVLNNIFGLLACLIVRCQQFDINIAPVWALLNL